jgi:tRNA(Ile2) C34 agmatinyltransferase TiaS
VSVTLDPADSIILEQRKQFRVWNERNSRPVACDTCGTIHRSSRRFFRCRQCIEKSRVDPGDESSINGSDAERAS